MSNNEMVAKKVVTPFLNLVKVVMVQAVASKKTADCFIDRSRYYFRDPNLDAWLPKNQLRQPKSKFSVQKSSEGVTTFKQAIESFLGQKGDVKTLSRLLKENRVTTTLPAIEDLIEREELNEDTGLRIGGCANFFFVKNNNKHDKEEGSVSVGRVGRYGGRWYANVENFGSSRVWHATDRFFFRDK